MKSVPRELAVIAAEINTKLRNETGNILDIGTLLIEAKRQLAHGEWDPWLVANFVFSARTAQKYVKAKKWSAKHELSSVLNLSPSMLYLLSAAGGESTYLEATMEAAAKGRVDSEVYERIIIDAADADAGADADADADAGAGAGAAEKDAAEIEDILDNPQDAPPESGLSAYQRPRDAEAAKRAIQARADRAAAGGPPKPGGGDMMRKADDAEQSAEERKQLNESAAALTQFKEDSDRLSACIQLLVPEHMDKARAYLDEIHDREPVEPVETFEAPPIAPVEPVKSLADISDDALATFKRSAQALLDFPNELAQSVKWFATDFAAERTKKAKAAAKKEAA
jgi:hypothetical protein